MEQYQLKQDNDIMLFEFLMEIEVEQFMSILFNEQQTPPE
jgi:hypothetical protein